MNLFTKISVFLMAFVCTACSSPVSNTGDSNKPPVDYVNPYMGNISHLLVPTFPTVHLPNSMMRATPARADYTAVRISGLPVMLTSHRGAKAFSLSPFQGDERDLKPVLEYSYDQEKLTPYSYSVYLDDQAIQADFGVSHQSAAYELQFGQDLPVYLILNSARGALSWDGSAISGYQELGNDTRVYLYLVPEELPQKVTALKEGIVAESKEAEGADACLVLNYPQGTKD